MAKLTRDEARIAATHLAYLACGIEKWLHGCAAEEQQRRLDFVVQVLTPDSLPHANALTFSQWLDAFFQGMPPLPDHVRWAYQAAYEEGWKAGKAGLPKEDPA
jgi:hypothetical protein